MKTAVEWLQAEFNKWAEGRVFIPQDILEQAKKMEKEQIMNAYCDGAKGGANGNKGQHKNGWVSIQMKEKYYNQTYKP